MRALQGEVKREAAERETQLELSTQQYHALQSKLEHMLATIGRETTEMKNVEQELREGMSPKEQRTHRLNARQSEMTDSRSL